MKFTTEDLESEHAVYEEVYNEVWSCSIDTIPDAIAFLNELYTKIPNKFKGCHNIDFDVGYEWGENYINFSVYYHRPYTDEEKKELLKQKKEEEAFTHSLKMSKYLQLKEELRL